MTCARSRMTVEYGGQDGGLGLRHWRKSNCVIQLIRAAVNWQTFCELKHLQPVQALSMGHASRMMPIAKSI
ncbi:hypothetical protein HZ326_22335 [Fusarium oxysporum f. sp. albedinis]|nr:hypothetical protein HZ326_22335 [Fusarium oxysporum f. sp. albedinis]